MSKEYNQKLTEEQNQRTRRLNGVGVGTVGREEAGGKGVEG
jgi:hypothetical protein